MREARKHTILPYVFSGLVSILLVSKPLHFGLVDHSHHGDHQCEAHGGDHDYRLTEHVKHCLVGEYEFFPVMETKMTVFADRPAMVLFYYPEINNGFLVSETYRKSRPRAPPEV